MAMPRHSFSLAIALAFALALPPPMFIPTELLSILALSSQTNLSSLRQKLVNKVQNLFNAFNE